MQNFTLFVGRIGLSLIFILSGIGKVMAYHATEKVLIAHGLPPGLLPLVIFAELGGGLAILCGLDRKSTRLNSSHPSISYAVFCLKKKKTTKDQYSETEYVTD